MLCTISLYVYTHTHPKPDIAIQGYTENINIRKYDIYIYVEEDLMCVHINA